MNWKTKVRAIAVLFVLTLAVAGVWAAGSDESPTAAAMTGDSSGPQYGGTLTFVLRDSEPPSPAISDANFGSLYWLEMMQEHPVAGDFFCLGQNKI